MGAFFELKMNIITFAFLACFVSVELFLTKILSPKMQSDIQLGTKY